MTRNKLTNKKIIFRLIKDYIFPHKFKIFLALIMMIISGKGVFLHHKSLTTKQ